MVKEVLKTKRGKWALSIAIVSAVGVIASISQGSTEALPGELVLIAISSLLAASAIKNIRKNSDTQNNDNYPPTSKNVTESDGIKITISTKTENRNVSYFLADGETISKLDLGWDTNPSGGFVNWSLYEVTGINQTTGRKNTRKYDAKCEEDALTELKKDGFAEPYAIRPVQHDAPTERQVEYLLSWNTSVPNGASKHDVTAILDRLEGSYDTVYEKQVSETTEHRYIRPLPGPSIEFAKYADEMGIYFSSFIGDDALFQRVVYSLGMRDRLAFFAYCALCSYHRFDIGNLLSSPYKDKLYEFADIAIQDESIIKSIEQRTLYDYKNIHKGTKVYKAVAAHFGIK